MVCDNNLHVSFIKSILEYDSETGLFFWKNRPDLSKSWNTRWAGKVAGNIRADGYISIRICGNLYLAHRIAWLINYGKWPNLILDHINQNPSDNRIKNLRECDVAQNGWNRKAQLNGSTGIKNINLDNRRKKYQVKIYAYGKAHWVGYFDNLEEAIAEKEKYITKLHGKYLNS